MSFSLGHHGWHDILGRRHDPKVQNIQTNNYSGTGDTTVEIVVVVVFSCRIEFLIFG